MNNPEIKIKEHKFFLSASKTIFWQNKNTLLISDLHLGKKLRLQNSPDIDSDLKRLATAIEEFKPKRILILGDLFDAKSKADPTLLKTLLKEVNKEVILILGNHDVLGEQTYFELGINNVLSELREDMFLFTHKPDKNVEDLVNIHGHLHPGVVIRKLTDNVIKVPCYSFKSNYICLPAFGGVTGKSVLEANNNQKIFTIEKDLVKQFNK